jgi:hypothetical protein
VHEVGAKGTFKELHVHQGQGSLYVRDYPGEGPAFVLLHGFPDNLHIYDKLAVRLSSAGVLSDDQTAFRSARFLVGTQCSESARIIYTACGSIYCSLVRKGRVPMTPCACFFL